MIQSISNKYRQTIAVILSLSFYTQIFLLPLHSIAAGHQNYAERTADSIYSKEHSKLVETGTQSPVFNQKQNAFIESTTNNNLLHLKPGAVEIYKPVIDDMGGPASPESSTFKSVNADNLVNLFTGDFSYSIPLLDVGGYPVNIFYNGGITMEQDASWVGLGWNINPGTVNRNMRGVPDDFDGTDTLIQQQNVKPNKTWGGEVGIDGEVVGIKTPNVNFNLGFSYNNYLGPELDLGAGVSVSIPITKTEMYENSAPFDSSQGLNLGFGANAKLSSRSGLSLAPSLNASLHSVTHRMDLGVGLSTSYNSRTGIKNLNINSEMSSYHFQTNLLGLPERVGSHVGLTSNTISFARPSYIPSLRMPMQYTNYSGQIELGGGMFGLRGAATVQGYYSESKIADGSLTIYKPMVGYLYLENGTNNKNAVMDFNRLNDGEVTPNTTVIAAPQYDYDIFTIQGEGTGGSIRAYRGDLGFVHDPETTSKDKNISIGFDIAPPGHYGGNWNIISAPTRSGGWDDGNNTLNQTMLFKQPYTNSSFENVYFRNPGEATISNSTLINKIGQDNLVRFKIDGSNVSPRLESQLETFSKKTNASLGTLSVASSNTTQQREKRTQVITMLNAGEASKIGLDKSIKSYLQVLDTNNNLQFNTIARVGGYRKSHHISEIDVLEQSGMRYVYGLPVYNTIQKDFSFSVTNIGDPVTNLVNYTPGNEPTLNNSSVNGNTGIDGYVSIQQTPAYATTFLITGLLSPDYVDVTGDGITEDDLGTAVKFNYTMSGGYHQWRTPRNNSNGNSAHFNVGLKTEKRDNKATISYGTREAWYMHSIESKSMIAIFKTSTRNDNKGVNSDIDGSINSTENANLKLDSILLYTKSDIKANGLALAIPIKTVHFEYNYTLCNGTPDNQTGGKLTLTSIYFTYNGQSRVSKNRYVFNYGNINSNFDNPNYALNSSDRWGVYKPIKDSANNPVNPAGLSNIDYPYTSSNKAVDDQYAAAWSLKKILLPSGGQLEVQYEADDYAYVQDRRACNMFSIYGFGNSTTASIDSRLYTVPSNQDQNYVYIQLPNALQNSDPVKAKQEIYAKYLEGIHQIAFKLNVMMPKGAEPLTVYANYGDYGICSNSTGTASNPIIYIQLLPISSNGPGPLANATVQFLINNLPGQAFPGYDLSDGTGLEDFFAMISSELNGLKNAFTQAVGQVRSAGGGSSVLLNSSFIRLNNPVFFKYGGGHRVKRVLLKDNWNAMSGQYNSQYGQDYDYTTTKIVNGVSNTISSGVASYEPGIGSEENPFREILQFQNQLPLASAIYGAIEMPVLEGLYPSPVVGYSQVTVRSIHRNGTQGNSVVKSAIGKQVTQFYTAKDYPSFSTYSPMNTMDYHLAPPFNFFNKETIDRRTTSQGFLVETNDMHGKMRYQAAYSESDPNTPLSYTYHTYKNTGVNGLNDRVNLVHNDLGGQVSTENIGVDMELMTDVRENSVISNGVNGQLQTDFFTFVPWPIFGIFMYPIQSYTENKYRAVTTTKLINYHAIEDSVIVNDKGSVISTKTIAYDAETGLPIVTKTANEFNDPVYNITYPAYWAYSGVAPAYKNINMNFSGVNFYNGRIQSSSNIDTTVFESGDELYIINQGTVPTDACGAALASGNVNKLWVFDMNKNNTSLTIPSINKSLVIMDSVGNLFTKSGVGFRIVRSGKRNNIGLTASSVTAVQNPISTINGLNWLTVNGTNNVVAATSLSFKEKWQVDKGVIPTVSFTQVNCAIVEILDCNGTLQNHINPYLKGLVGNIKPFRNYTYYGLRNETDPTVNTAIRKNGYISNFSNYWLFDLNKNLVPDTSNPNWVWNNELTKINAHGQELETRNALNIYSSAQYGFNKDLTTAVSNNARYNEMFYEGFEDNAYGNSINNINTSVCSNTKHIDFSGLPNSYILNTDSSGFKAHTGKYVLGLSPGTNSLLIPVMQNIDNFSIRVKQDSLIQLTDIGGILFSKDVFPVFGLNHNNQTTLINPVFSNSVVGLSSNSNQGWLYDSVNSVSPFQHLYSGFSTSTLQYVNIMSCGYYKFNLYVTDDNINTCDNDAYFNITVSTLDDILLKEIECGDISVNCAYNLNYSNNCDPNYSKSFTDSVYLIPGIYKIGSYSQFYHPTCSTEPPAATTIGFNGQFGYTSNLPGPSYKSLNSNTNCYINKPIASNDSMLNSTFTIPFNKKMEFSAWVHELGNNKLSYDSNSIVISDGVQSISLKPNGSVIDGWQRYEGYFTANPSATSVNLSFLNNCNSPVYFDDIRIHPFNANMKSYVYDPRTLKLMAELDENNYASFYNYDEEGQLIRVKKETIQGIKTIKEIRTSKQKSITDLQ